MRAAETSAAGTDEALRAFPAHIANQGISFIANMEPGRNPPRYQRQQVSYTGWIVAAIAILAVVAAIAHGMSDHSRTAGTGAPSTTTGQSNPAPGAPQPGPPATNR